MHINFVVKGDDYHRFPVDPDKDWQFFTKTNMIWSYLTCLRLKKFGYPDIGYSNNIVSGAVNVGTASAMGIAGFHYTPDYKKTVYVVIRADKYYASSKHLSVVQSPEHSLKYRNSYYITHWPQPGLLKRKKTGHGVKKIGMAGIPKHYAVSRYQERFRKDMADRGIEIVHLDRSRWHDYSDIDIVLAVREFNKDIITHKPASKLINGWKAKVPVICNPESTYRWIGSRGEDFLEVENYEQLIDAIDLLSSDRGRYLDIVEKGAKKGEVYTNEKVCLEWVELFDGIRKESITVAKPAHISMKKTGFRFEEVIHDALKYFRKKGIYKK
ncbi:hypothetical protein [Natronogracilivirga saccharolytica]|uniref:Glycosyltransferase family 1 protein n=1 Tax=Natronogracilivirga saccharolytica TaxID=2812953 RepID=A0A8J7UUT1_9BACT|nr:hypothetical protein [Natronogracilivirga saccharolytica]MBP3193941.1 hypothetical protein [Natronogracilivirga saccharolytica]